MTSTAPDADPAKAFERCVSAAERLEAGDATREEFERLVADLSLIPRDWPGRDALAERLARATLPGLDLVAEQFVQRSMAMVDVFDASSGSSLVDRFGLTVLRFNALVRSGPQDSLGDAQSLEEYFRRQGLADDAELGVQILGFVSRCLMAVAADDTSTLRSLSAEAHSLLRQLSTWPATSETRALVAMVELLADDLADDEHQQRSGAPTDPAAVAAQTSRFVEILDLLPAELSRPGIADIRRRLSATLGRPEGGTAGSPADGQTPDTAEIDFEATALSKAGAAEMRAVRSARDADQDDPASLDRAVRDAQYAIELSDAHGGPGPDLLKTAAASYLYRGIVSGSRSDIETSIGFSERAIAASASHLRADSSELYMLLASGYWHTDRFADSVDAALRGLAGYAWLALIQNDAPDAHSVVRHAAHRAAQLARAWTRPQDAADAARILEAGRALIVFAAQQTGTVATRLAETGHDALAEEWNCAVAAYGVDSVAPQLRLRAFCALAGVPVGPDGSIEANVVEAARGLVEPPEIEQIQAALRELEQDALVYLVAGEGDLPGFAVVVQADAEPVRITLPDLDMAEPQAFEQVVGRLSRAARDLKPATAGSVRLSAEDSVTALCDWAWRAAVDPLLDHLWATGLPERVAMDDPDRPVRLVLAPMGELALVPWHAARCDFGEIDGVHVGVRHALHFAVFSYTASARMLCDVAARGHVPVSDAGLVVGDPDASDAVRDLPAARREAISIITSFYPDGTYLGRLRDGAEAADGGGTKQQVLDWLADPGGGTLLHLACHGSTSADTGRDDTSYVLLDGGARLSAEELINSLQAASGHEIALAVLAACSTAKSGRGYDEAFNLGTVLLHHGVRSVISAQWPVPDEDTSVLMFMFHYFLKEADLPPGDALCAAQLWMLGDREPPYCMPQDLRDRARTRSVGGDIAAWAGFVHSGR